MLATDVVVEEFLSHYGVKGMHWGVRKAEVAGAKSPSAIIGIEKFPDSTAAAISSVSANMSKGYGFQITEVKPLVTSRFLGYYAYVELNNKGGHTIHLRADEKFQKSLNKQEASGWFVPSGGRTLEGVMTHESAHSLLHAMDLSGKNFRERYTSKEPISDIRLKAWDAATKQGIADGTLKPRGKGLHWFTTTDPVWQIRERLSGYAKNTLYIEESEAEIFTAYHWSPNPPKYIDAFMREVNTNMTGHNVPPFSGRKVS